VHVPFYVGLAKSGIIRSPFFPSAEGDLALAKSDRPGLRVLFFGNSFTYYNEMPAMVHELAAQDHGARPLYSVEYTAPNVTAIIPAVPAPISPPASSTESSPAATR
jgi:hypothetical protein